MKKGGLSLRKGIALLGLMMLLYGVTSFIYEHSYGVSMNHISILLMLIPVMLYSIAVFVFFLMAANENKAVGQKKISNWLMGAAVVFFLLIALEYCAILNTSVLGATLGVSIFEIPKTYIYEIVLILIYPMLLTYIVRAVGNEGLTSRKAKTAYLQIAVLTLMEFLLVMTLDSVWIVEMAIFNLITYMVVINISEFGKKLSYGDKAGLFIVYIAVWVLLLLVYCGNGFLKPDEYFYENSWDLHRKNIYEIMKHASLIGTSPAMTGSETIRDFLILFPENSIIWLLFYGGWFAVGIYIAVLIGFVYLLYKALCPSIRRVNVMYAVYFIAFLSMLCRVVCGLLQNFGMLPIPINLPFSTEFGLIMDTFAVVLLAGFGNLNHSVYWDCAILEELDELFGDEENLSVVQNLKEEELLEEEMLEFLEEEENSFKSSTFLKKIVGILVFILVVGMWIGTLFWLDRNVLSVYDYEIIENQQEQERVEAEELKETAEKFGIYADFILNEEYMADFDEGKENLSYEVADIDGNGITELLMSDGNYTHAPTWIYTMNDEEVVFLGRYSQNGKLEVLKGEDHSIICSEYGGMGAFYDVYTKMENGKMETITVFFSDGTGSESEEVLYYMGFPVPEGIRADNWIFDYDVITEQYLVSEEEFDKAQEEIVDREAYVEIVFTTPYELE